MDSNKEENSNSNFSDDNDYVVRIRGLPWSASKEDIIKFFEGANMKEGGHGIHLTMSKEGRPSGEAYIEFDGEEDVTKALTKDNEHLGSRYIEVFRSKKKEMEWALRRCGLDGEEAFGDACVRLRGLPFGCSKEEIAQFFTGLEIVRNGITLPTDFQGRSTGEAYVQFASQDIAEKAMGKHKEKIGHRYIEIFKSSLQEIRSAMGMGPVRMRNMGSNRLSPYDRMDRPGGFGGGYGMARGARNFGGFDDGYRDFGGSFENFPAPGGRRGGGGPMGNIGGDRLGPFGRGRENFSTGHRIHMRGLPYRAVERDIYEFFAPMNLVSVRIRYEPSGRSSGEADVEFNSHDEAAKAMKRDKEKIQHRYIELFLHSEPEPFGREGGNFNTMGRGGGGNFGPGEERSFGPGPGMDRQFGRGGGRPFMPEAERSFGPQAERGFGPNAPDRGFGFSGGERSFGPSGGNERSFGGSPGNRSFGLPASERPFNANSERFGTSGERPMNMQSERSFGMSESRQFGDRAMGPPGTGDMERGGFRNGMSNNAGGGGGFRNEGGYGGGGHDNQRTDESEFYGSGKLFGENSFQSSMGQGMNNMLSGSNYSSF